MIAVAYIFICYLCAVFLLLLLLLLDMNALYVNYEMIDRKREIVFTQWPQQMAKYKNTYFTSVEKQNAKVRITKQWIFCNSFMKYFVRIIIYSFFNCTDEKTEYDLACHLVFLTQMDNPTYMVTSAANEAFK